MEIGLRVLALIIDLAVSFGSLPLVMGATGWLLERSGDAALVLVPFGFALFFIWPFLCLAIPTGIWGKTLGKLMCRLTVTNYSNLDWIRVHSSKQRPVPHGPAAMAFLIDDKQGIPAGMPIG